MNKLVLGKLRQNISQIMEIQCFQRKIAMTLNQKNKLIMNKLKKKIIKKKKIKMEQDIQTIVWKLMFIKKTINKKWRKMI